MGGDFSAGGWSEVKALRKRAALMKGDERILGDGDFIEKATSYLSSLPKTGDVRILFISNGKKDWHTLLSTDTELEASEILSYYASHWAIEVVFKDAKQYV